MKKILKMLVLCLLSAALLCCALPSAFAAEDKDSQVYTIGLDAMGTVYAHWTVKNATTSTSISTPAQPEQTAQEYDDGPILSVLTVAGALITTLAVAAFI